MGIEFGNKFSFNWLKGRSYLSKNDKINLLVEAVKDLLDRVADLERRLEN